MKSTGITLVLTALLLAAAGCSKQQVASDAAAPASEQGQSITIMTFNVENLFDSKDDPGKDDYTYLPAAAKQSDEHRALCAGIEVDRWREQCLDWDWNEDVVNRKLAAIAAAILQVDGGHGPDVLALQEIENIGILERLRTQYLSAANYLPAILIEGHDARGIDVAFLSRLAQVGEPVLHRLPAEGIDSEKYRDTRGILQATFTLPDGSLLTGYAVHFPAPFHPTLMRVVAYNQLNYLKSTLPPDRYVFAAGDFNTTFSEDRDHQMLDRFARPHWTVAHDLGCDDCRGTQYYAAGDSWSFLDMILWSPPAERGKNATWELRAESVTIPNAAPGQVRDDGTPGRWQMPEGLGVSDHWPLLVTIQRK